MKYVNDKDADRSDIFESRPNCKKPYDGMVARKAVSVFVGEGISTRQAQKILNEGGVVHTGDYEIRKRHVEQKSVRTRENIRNLKDTGIAEVKSASRRVVAKIKKK
jgi:transposase